MRIYRAFGALLAGSALTWSMAAVAQTTAQSKPGSPETGAGAPTQAVDQELTPASAEIVVTATRRNETLQKVPMSVNVVTGDALKKLKIFDVKDVAELSPGLELTNSTGRNNTTTLRGISFDPDQGTSPAVQVYYNEIPTDAQTAYTAIYDIQQIEVLRGPQGLLRGLSAPAGAITIGTVRPGFDHVDGYVQATGTSRAGYNFQGAVTLPFSSVWSLRTAMLVDGNRLNDVRDVNRDDQRSRSRTESARATLGFKPSDDFSAYLTYQYLSADNHQFQQVVGAGNTPGYQLFPFFGGFFIPDTTEQSGPPLSAKNYGAVSEGDSRFQNNTSLVNLAADWNLGPATLSFVGAHQDSTLKSLRDLDPGNAVPNYTEYQRIKVPYKVNTAELRLTTNESSGFGGGIGAFYTKQTGTTVVDQPGDTFFFPANVDTTEAVLGSPPYLPISTHIDVPVYTQTWSFNANGRFRSGGLTIEGGLRYSIIKNRQNDYLSLTSPGNPLGGVPAFSQPSTDIIPEGLRNFTNHPLTGGATISYSIMPTLNIYAAYGHSFRAGSTAVGAPAGVSNDLVHTKPEKTDSWEVGAKGSFADHRINFAVAAYYQKLDNFLTRFTSIYYDVPTANPPTGFFDFNYNAKATIKGIEGSLDGRITHDWDFGVSASYTRARFDHALVPCNDYAGTGSPNQDGTPAVQGGGDVSFCRSTDRLSNIPDFNLTANTEIRFPMERITPFIRGLIVYRPGFYSQQADYHYRDQERVNLYVGVRTNDQKWEIDVFAKNLLNQRRITGIGLGDFTVPTAVGVPFDSGYQGVTVMNPREFGLTTSFKF